MKHPGLLLLLAFAASLAGTALVAVSPAPDPETQIATLERAWMEAWRTKDRATCERILADDFVLTSARGQLLSKTQWLEGAMGPYHCEEFTWEELRVRPFGDVAVVHARARQKASVNGQDWSGVFLVTDVWVRRHGAWQVVARHGTGPLASAP